MKARIPFLLGSNCVLLIKPKVTKEQLLASIEILLKQAELRWEEEKEHACM